MVYLLFQESSLERMYVADRGWVISRSEIKEETLMPAGDIRGGDDPSAVGMLRSQECSGSAHRQMPQRQLTRSLDFAQRKARMQILHVRQVDQRLHCKARIAFQISSQNGDLK